MDLDCSTQEWCFYYMMLNKTFSGSIYAHDELHMFVGGKAYTSCASIVINGVWEPPLG
jgi:hypothetical protein